MDSYYTKTFEVAALLENYGAITAIDEVPFRKNMKEGFFYENSLFVGIEFILPAKESCYRAIVDKETNKLALIEIKQNTVEMWFEDVEELEVLEKTLDEIIGEGVYL